MPLEEKEMDEVLELKSKEFLTKMIHGKFYSMDEIYELIMGQQLDKIGQNIVPTEFRENQILTMTDTLGIVTKGVIRICSDLSYFESVVQAQYAVGNLRAAKKNGKRYYCKA
jgi:hypothetical protein